jgi:hypothetical protein
MVLLGGAEKMLGGADPGTDNEPQPGARRKTNNGQAAGGTA